jgi:hypothetical protein
MNYIDFMSSPRPKGTFTLHVRTSNVHMLTYDFNNVCPQLSTTIFLKFFHAYSNSRQHRVNRVLGFFSSRPNWDQSPHPPASMSPPLVGGGGGAHKLGGEGSGGPNSDEGTDTIGYSR